jgi:uncharacterized integral membrane protein (TIGR00697 family)
MTTDNQTIALTGLFVTALVTAQVLGSKLVPIAIPAIGTAIVPAGTIAYALTFFASDVMAETQGKAAARRMVNVGFAMNFVLLALVWVAIAAPVSEAGIPQEPFASVLGASANIIAGSLVAYLVSQHWDVTAFHAIGRRTGGRWLWARNLGSTATSQAIDTVLFTSVAFVIAPIVFGVGHGVPLPVAVSIAVGQYVAKAILAVVDTPFVYAAVRHV